MVIDRAEGSWLTDESGIRSLIFFAGTEGVNCGHNNPYTKGKLLDPLTDNRVVHPLDTSTVAKQTLLEALGRNAFPGSSASTGDGEPDAVPGIVLLSKSSSAYGLPLALTSTRADLGICSPNEPGGILPKLRPRVRHRGQAADVLG